MRENKIQEISEKDIKVLIQSELCCIADNVVIVNEDMPIFNLSADHILQLVDELVDYNNYLIERLKHSESARFGYED